MAKECLPEVTKFVAHSNPDLDVLVGFWLLSLHAKNWSSDRIVLVPAGERLAGSEDDPSVLHLDTGGGPFDHHDTDDRTSATARLAKYLGVADDPAYAVLVEATIKADHAEEVPPTDLRHIVGGYVYQHRRGKLKLAGLLKECFKLFSSISEQQVAWAKSAEDFERVSRWRRLENGLKLCVLDDRPDVRNEAFKHGADVVLWTKNRNGKRYVGIHANRSTDIDLGPVAALLRDAERELRKLPQYDGPLDYFQMDEDIEPSWYRHISGKIILNGSLKHPLKENEQSLIEMKFLEWLVVKGLSRS